MSRVSYFKNVIFSFSSNGNRAKMLSPQNFAESGNEKISLRLNLIGWDPKGPVIAADLPPSFPRLENKQNLVENSVLFEHSQMEIVKQILNI